MKSRYKVKCHWLDGYEFEQTPGVGDGLRSPARCRPWGHKESDMTEQLNNRVEKSSTTLNSWSKLKSPMRDRRTLSTSTSERILAPQQHASREARPQLTHEETTWGAFILLKVLAGEGTVVFRNHWVIKDPQNAVECSSLMKAEEGATQFNTRP